MLLEQSSGGCLCSLKAAEKNLEETAPGELEEW